MRITPSVLLTATILLYAPILTHAQETTGTGEDVLTETGAVTGTGTGVQLPVETEEDRLARIEARRRRMKSFRSRALKARSNAVAYRSERDELVKERTSHRNQCRTQIHQAEPSAAFSTALRCYRGALTMNLKLLRKQRPFIEGMVNVSEELRTTALKQIDELMDALMAVIDGIDTDLFWSIDEVAETKQNLFRVYRLPFWLTLSHIRAERMILWMGHMSERIESALEGIELTEEGKQEQLSQASSCFEEARTLLETARASGEYDGTIQHLNQAHEQLNTCITLLRRKWRIQEEPAEPEVPEEEDEVLKNTELMKSQAKEDYQRSISRITRSRLQFGR